MKNGKKRFVSVVSLVTTFLLLSVGSFGFQAVSEGKDQAGLSVDKTIVENLGPANTWTNRSPTNPPPALAYHAMVYDSQSGKVILFGGWDGNLFDDTWAYDYAANTWVNRSPTNPPPARAFHAMAYDSQSGKVILFGGWDGYGNLFNDTWAYDYAANTWVNRNPTNQPPALNGHAMAYDSQSGKVILFGGGNDISGYLNDTWAYDYAANTWVNRSPTNPPPTRNSHAMAYDSQSGKVILFGGWDDNGDFNDTWIYDYAANTWVNRSPTNPPPARLYHALAYDSQSGKVILFDGRDEYGNLLSDTWAYDYVANTWVNRSPTNPPPARDSHAMAYDCQSGKVILFGGRDEYGNSFNDTWAYDYGEDSSTHTVTYSLQPNWNMISLPVAPTSADPLVVFGGLPSPWYLFEWDPLAGTYVGKELISLELGTGYWLKVPTAVSYPVTGQPNGAAQTGIDLGLGWNLIGIPYEGVIPWGAVRVSKDGGALVTLDDAIASNWIQGMFFHWSGNTYDMLTSGGNFQSLFGYWVKAKTGGISLLFSQAGEPIKVGLVTDVGGRGDKAFNDSALRGLEDWAAGQNLASIPEDLQNMGIVGLGVTPVVVESKANEDYVPNLTKMAQEEKCDLVIAVGFMQTQAVQEVAAQFPDTKFMLIDGTITDESFEPLDPYPANVVSYLFKEHEGSFLVGALAAQMTKANILGFVGGMEIGLIKKYEAGYKAGIKTLSSTAAVLVGYTGNFTSADDGKTAAETQFGGGADIVYHAAMACGIGVIQAAKDKGEGFFAIGMDSDQDYMAPGHVLTSMIKHVDMAVWLACKLVVYGSYAGGIVELGLKEGGVGYSPLTYTKDIIPQTAIDIVELLRQMIIDGTIVVPDTLEKLDIFIPPPIPPL